MEEILLKQAEICKELNHFYLATFLFDLSKLENNRIISILEMHKTGLKHYPYAFLTIVELLAKLKELTK